MFTKSIGKKKKEARKENLGKPNYPLKQARNSDIKVGPHQRRGGMAVPLLHMWHGLAMLLLCLLLPLSFAWHALPLLSGTACFMWHSLLVWPSSRIDLELDLELAW